MSFSFEQEKNGKLLIPGIGVSLQQGKFVTAVYRKPTLSGLFTHFESFSPMVYKFVMI